MLKDLKNLIKSDKEILSKDSSVHNLTVDVVTIIDHISRYSPLVFYSMHESMDIESGDLNIANDQMDSYICNF